MTSPKQMISRQEHPGLALYYAHESQELRGAAKQWEGLAEFYEQHPAPGDRRIETHYAVHCRAIAAYYRQAAEEADALANEHRRQESQPVGP